MSDAIYACFNVFLLVLPLSLVYYDIVCKITDKLPFT